jgi:hypothetical protein
MIQPDPKKSKVKVVEKKTTVTTKPKAKTVSQRLGDITLRDVKDAGETALNLSTLGGYGVAKKKVKELTGMKSGGTVKKAKSGFAALAPPYDKATFADKIAGAKANAGKAKSGTKMKMGGKMAAKQAAVAIAMKKAGKTPKKMQYGGKAASMAPMKMGGAMMKTGGKMAKCKYGCK